MNDAESKDQRVKKVKETQKSTTFLKIDAQEQLLKTPKNLNAIRVDFIAGILTNEEIQKKYSITKPRLAGYATKYGWREDELSPEERVQTKDLVIDGKARIYLGPLVAEERIALAANTLENAKNLIGAHKRVISKALLLAERGLNELIKNDGKIEKVKIKKVKIDGGGEEEQEIVTLVDGTQRLAQLSKILQSIIPLDRVTHGIDDYYKPQNDESADSEARHEMIHKAIIDGMNQCVAQYREAKRVQDAQPSLVELRAKSEAEKEAERLAKMIQPEEDGSDYDDSL